MGPSQIASAVGGFSSCKRCVLFNVRLFQEGVEIPDLNAVFFAAPRRSFGDIIQVVRRPLNRPPNKPISYVFLQEAMNPRYRADHPINLQSLSTLVPFTDALMDEDPKLFEYMLGPQKKSYDFNVVGLRSPKLTAEKVVRFVLPAIRRGVRYSCVAQTDRLHRAARLPWKYVFGEMRRIALECNRYPKTNDAWVAGDTSVSMNLFYKYCRKGYTLYQEGQQTYPQTCQIRDLESLPEWRRYGVEGPHPWRECIATLESHLATHKAPPPLDVHKGGFIGLDATPFERPSGCLMHANQCDGKCDLRLAPEKQRDMDELCKRYGIKWRKTRNADGVLRKNERTFITESYDQFKRMFAQAGTNPLFREYVEKHFPGCPGKHPRMENLDMLMDGKVPPRHEPVKKRKLGADKRAKKRENLLKMGEVEGANGGSGVGAPKKKRGGPPGSKNKKTASAPKKPSSSTRGSVLGRAVMCRICRTKVSAAEWAHHVASDEHKVAALNGARALEARGLSISDTVLV